MNIMENQNNAVSSEFLEEDCDVYEYEEAFPDFARRYADDPPPPPMDACVPMTPDRVARKQRSLNRRGGANHYALMKSAVLASMETMESDVDDDTVRSRRNSLVTLQECGGETPTSPRKRIRRVRTMPVKEQSDEDEAIARASSLMGTLNMAAVVQPTPASEGAVRRVSRRTSYDSRVSEVSDLDFDDL